jgi:sterol desaturase/sphingolipid hydroxylase (fatty acid hydroxylase superfamily)
MEGLMETRQWIMSNETPIRLGLFFGVLAVMALWEWLAPRRALTVSKVLRWSSNLGIVFLNTLLLRVLFPAAAVGMAMFAHSRGWGLFNHFETPYALAVLASVVAMDFIIYLQHVMFHAVPALWRLHRVHHADLDLDVTSGARFHPIEIILSMVIKFAAIAVLGTPALAIVIFEVVLNATAMFNHSNVRLHLGVDAVLRLLVVTPDMHRVHHSVEHDETNTNFGFNLPWWDRLLGTYRAQPRAGHEGMTIGIDTFRDPKRCDNLWGMLTLPFVGKITGYAINRPQMAEADEAR